MEPADQILELSEESGNEKKERAADEKFRSRTALVIAIMAMLLAITSLGGGNAGEDIMNNNIEASDTWAFYQAKSIRQTSNKLAAEELETELLMRGDQLSPELRQEVQKKIDQYNETVKRYEDEPDPKDPTHPLKGEGRKQLAARAKSFEDQRDRAQLQDPNFDYAEAFFQIAIVLASVAILATSRLIVKLSLVVGLIATVLMINGYFLLFPLPF